MEEGNKGRMGDRKEIFRREQVEGEAVFSGVRPAYLKNTSKHLSKKF